MTEQSGLLIVGTRGDEDAPMKRVKDDPLRDTDESEAGSRSGESRTGVEEIRARRSLTAIFLGEASSALTRHAHLSI